MNAFTYPTGVVMGEHGQELDGAAQRQVGESGQQRGRPPQEVQERRYRTQMACCSSAVHEPYLSFRTLRPPGVARAFGCEARAGPCVAELAGGAGRATGVCSTGFALRLVPAAHAAAPRFHPGPRGAASLGGLSPTDPSSPASPISPLEGPVHGSCPRPGAGKRHAGQVRRSNHLGGSSSGHNE
jgi:hypothetical protein